MPTFKSCCGSVLHRRERPDTRICSYNSKCTVSNTAPAIQRWKRQWVARPSITYKEDIVGIDHMEGDTV
ncbi:hypothetical protein PISMIDRAFT_675019 [Pisolithus microcarpus 441]|uniref:Uncharacterized protein n=1 Tax=Pisolithus microcarpus 441 TaxID=765257 RepID=A0A0D0A546_9AGAM|nr:hypothetical protein PISMIDRAFT_675019 [Pisolithus microcarpus 441]